MGIGPICARLTLIPPSQGQRKASGVQVVLLHRRILVLAGLSVRILVDLCEISDSR